MSLRWLKWLTILLPVAFLIAFDYLRHFVFPQYLHTFTGFALVYAIVLVGVFVFSMFVFRLLERMQERVAQQNRELAAVSEVAESLSLSLSIDQILADSLDRVMNLVQADAGAICLLDAEREELFSTVHRGFSPQMVERLRRQKLGEEAIGTQVIRTGLPVIIPNWEEYGNPRIVELSRREGFHSSISFPLTSQGRVGGILVLASRREKAFPPSSIKLISGIANQVAMAAERAAIFQESSQQAQDLGAVNEVSAVASSSLDLREVMKAALGKAIDVLRMDAGEIWLWEESTQEMVVEVHTGSFPEAFREITHFKKGEGYPGLVAETGEVVSSPDIAQDERFLRDAVRRAGFHLFVCVPLKAKGRVVGAMDLTTQEHRQLAPRELKLMTSIGNQIGMAIANAHLYEQVQELAVTEERGRIAREIHDGVAQVLGYFNTKTLAVEKFLEKGEVELARQQVAQLERTAREAYADVREAILGLRSTIARREGFIPALEDYLDKFHQMSGISASISIAPEDADFHLHHRVEIQLIRIIQEALSNVRKHSGANQAWVRLGARDSEVIAVIEDKGRGFDPSQLARGDWPRFGLQTMRERAEALGGSLEILSRPGGGTQVRVSMPRLLEGENSAYIARG